MEEGKMGVIRLKIKLRQKVRCKAIYELSQMNEVARWVFQNTMNYTN